MTNVSISPKLIYPATRRPYYIVAPRYIRTSAGIRALHLLCHSLNKIGESAFMYIFPQDCPLDTATRYDLLTPVVTQRIIDEHFSEKLAPIVVYPETIQGNPLNAPSVVRYVLNFPGLLGGDAAYPPSELVYSYSEALGEAAGVPQNVLFIPTTDTSIFHSANGKVRRKGSCFYASKYMHFHKGQLFDITNESVEIKREGRHIQTPSEIADLFRRSEVFYTYENTALAIEAVLCGCPAVFIPNPYLTDIIGSEELGADGYAWGTDPSEIKRARDTVERGRQNYLRLYDGFWKQLDDFVNKTREHATNVTYTEKMLGPNHVQIEPQGWSRESLTPANRAFSKAWKKPWKRTILRTTLRLVGSRVRDRT